MNTLRIKNLTNSYIPFKNFSLKAKEIKDIDDGLFELNKSMILSLEYERKISFNIIKTKIVEQEVTPSTSTTKRGRKSKSKKETK